MKSMKNTKKNPVISSDQLPKGYDRSNFRDRSFGKRKMEVGAVLRSVVMRQMAEAFYYLKAQTAFHGSLKVLWQKI